MRRPFQLKHSGILITVVIFSHLHAFLRKGREEGLSRGRAVFDTGLQQHRARICPSHINSCQTGSKSLCCRRALCHACLQPVKSCLHDPHRSVCSIDLVACAVAKWLQGLLDCEGRSCTPLGSFTYRPHFCRRGAAGAGASPFQCGTVAGAGSTSGQDR